MLPAPVAGHPASDIRNIENVGDGNIGLVTVSAPGPSTVALAGVGLASMLIFRRKIK
jgi:hypothetical protein